MRPPQYRQMTRLVFLTAFVAALSLAHLQVRLATRDLDIQTGRYQAQREELRQQKQVLINQISRLRGDDRMLDYGHERLGLVALPADQIPVWRMPATIAQTATRVCSQVELARLGKPDLPQGEGLIARVLGAVLSPARVNAKRESPKGGTPGGDHR